MNPLKGLILTLIALNLTFIGACSCEDATELKRKYEKLKKEYETLKKKYEAIKKLPDNFKKP